MAKWVQRHARRSDWKEEIAPPPPSTYATLSSCARRMEEILRWRRAKKLDIKETLLDHWLYMQTVVVVQERSFCESSGDREELWRHGTYLQRRIQLYGQRKWKDVQVSGGGKFLCGLNDFTFISETKGEISNGVATSVYEFTYDPIERKTSGKYGVIGSTSTSCTPARHLVILISMERSSLLSRRILPAVFFSLNNALQTSWPNPLHRDETLSSAHTPVGQQFS